jgi:anti-sigma28 factor (negative regulator of flagellin synthesis)
MMINKTNDYIPYRRTLTEETVRAPRFIRREATPEGADIVEISEEARKKLENMSRSALLKGGFLLPQTLNELIHAVERQEEINRKDRVDELKALVRRGEYDFDNFEKTAGAGNGVMDQLISPGQP